MNNSNLIDDDTIINFLNMRKKIHKDKNWGMNLSEKEFIKGMTILTPQSYGSRIETYIRNRLESMKNSATNNNGDICVNNKNLEVKISILSSTNNSLNMVQIRLFHDIDYYLCVAFDMRNVRSYSKYIFLLSHKDMENETRVASAAHGTKTSNLVNRNIELRLSLLCEDYDDTFRRWKEKFLIKELEDVKKHV
jgi:hypothetical protein